MLCKPYNFNDISYQISPYKIIKNVRYRDMVSKF